MVPTRLGMWSRLSPDVYPDKRLQSRTLAKQMQLKCALERYANAFGFSVRFVKYLNHGCVDWSLLKLDLDENENLKQLIREDVWCLPHELSPTQASWHGLSVPELMSFFMMVKVWFAEEEHLRNVLNTLTQLWVFEDEKSNLKETKVLISFDHSRPFGCTRKNLENTVIVPRQ